MWKSKSIKTQLIIILLIPILGLIFMTGANIKSSFDKYRNIENGLEHIDNIAKLSQGISEISEERAYFNYAIFDSSKSGRFIEEKQKTIDWFTKNNFKDTIITRNLDVLYTDLIKLRSDIKNQNITKVATFKTYSNLNKILEKLIEREVALNENPKLSNLARNYFNYVMLEEASMVRRGVILEKINRSRNNELLDDTMFDFYFKSKSRQEDVYFDLENLRLRNVNNNLNKFLKSKSFKSFYWDSDLILHGKLRMSSDAWWKKATKVIDGLKVLNHQNLSYITNFANQEKDSALKTIIISTILLIVFIIVIVVITFKLVTFLSKSLKEISSSLTRVSLGEITENQNFDFTSEFSQISNSFNQLLKAKKQQLELANEIGSGVYGSIITVRSDKDVLNRTLNNMSLDLQNLHKETNEISWLERNLIEINNSIVESKELNDFGDNLCEILVKQTHGCQATFYITNSNEDHSKLQRIGGYAYDKNSPDVIEFGEGLVGATARANQQQCLNNLEQSYSYVASSLGKSELYNVLITPLAYKNSVIGVIEIGSLENFEDIHKKLLNNASDSIGSAIEAFVRNAELKQTAEEINRKNNILQVQEEELRQSNDELNRQTLLLQQSEEELRAQAAELEQTNAYLEEKGRELEDKNQEINIKNKDLIEFQDELKNKAEEIERASKYKSEFLANMSHELRTPLNSILILSDLLKENTAGNLTENQIDNLSIISASGKDLLNLISDILDISKIEAGKMEVYPEKFNIESITHDVSNLFGAQMSKKKIDFTSEVSEDCPRMIFSDLVKIEQIIKNFLSNALKFTPENGKVSILFTSGKDKNTYGAPQFDKLKANEILCIEVQDSGIGISEENKAKLFQSFQQADSSTSRKYGGTGLGLFISKQMANLLGGEVYFESQLNKGSQFVVCIPVNYVETELNNIQQSDNAINLVKIENEAPQIELKPKQEIEEKIIDLTENVADDRNEIVTGDKTVLIIEDDETFANILFNLAHENGFKAIMAYQGESGFEYAKKYKPQAIILDMKLPGVDGWTVLKWLKENKDLQHIPVHVITGMDREKLAKEMGATDFWVKPITTEKLKEAFVSIEKQINKTFKKVLILEDDVKLNHAIKELVYSEDKSVICIQANTFAEAESILNKEEIDCVIVDIGLPDSESIENIGKLKKISKNQDVNIIINTGRSLSEKEELDLHEIANSIIIKTENAVDRLKDDLLYFLNKVKTVEKSKKPQNANLLKGDLLKGKKILVVDDDIRNIYSLSSVLTAKGAVIQTAFNGIEALDALKKNHDIDIVLMDIMMPEMDGYEAIKAIRENPKWKDLPIIALTAKAMKGDREEILKIGASDYQSKPLDIQKIISLISIWIYK